MTQQTEKKMDHHQGHWVLAKLGKRVLRPGGLEMTRQMLHNLHIEETDDVVEFAPGLGITAKMTAQCRPHSYTAVERNEEAAAIVRERLSDVLPEACIVMGDAGHTGLPDASATKVYGEAMLTMQSMEEKRAIIREAARILKPGGLYGIHEIGLRPDDIADEKVREIHRALQTSVMANVSPLTQSGWTALLEEAGFEVAAVYTNGMHLLEPGRMIADEGLPRCLLIVGRMLCCGQARRAVLKMRKNFRKYADHLNAISIVARKK